MTQIAHHPLVTWLQCTACQQWLPARAEFFGRRALAGTSAHCVCLKCSSTRSSGAPALQAQPELERTCSHCNETWPLTPEFFHHQSGRWLSICRACEIERNRARRNRTTPAPYVSDAIAPLLTGAHFFAGCAA